MIRKIILMFVYQLLVMFAVSLIINDQLITPAIEKMKN